MAGRRMRTIKVTIPPGEYRYGRAVVVPVVVDWFPWLTADQVLQNSIARVDGRPEPHPDPNVIQVYIEGEL